MNHLIRPFLRWLALFWLALGMSVPVSAWTAHNAAHGAAQVAVDEHHHHDGDGGISVHDHDDGEAPDGGHDHMPSILLGAMTVPDSNQPLAMPAAARERFALPVTHSFLNHPSDGLRRPPRLG